MERETRPAHKKLHAGDSWNVGPSDVINAGARARAGTRPPLPLPLPQPPAKRSHPVLPLLPSVLIMHTSSFLCVPSYLRLSCVNRSLGTLCKQAGAMPLTYVMSSSVAHLNPLPPSLLRVHLHSVLYPDVHHIKPLQQAQLNALAASMTSLSRLHVCVEPRHAGDELGVGEAAVASSAALTKPSGFSVCCLSLLTCLTSLTLNDDDHRTGQTPPLHLWGTRALSMLTNLRHLEVHSIAQQDVPYLPSTLVSLGYIRIRPIALLALPVAATRGLEEEEERRVWLFNTKTLEDDSWLNLVSRPLSALKFDCSDYPLSPLALGSIATHYPRHVSGSAGGSSSSSTGGNDPDCTSDCSPDDSESGQGRGSGGSGGSGRNGSSDGISCLRTLKATFCNGAVLGAPVFHGLTSVNAAGIETCDQFLGLFRLAALQRLHLSAPRNFHLVADLHMFSLEPLPHLVHLSFYDTHFCNDQFTRLCMLPAPRLERFHLHLNRPAPGPAPAAVPVPIPLPIPLPLTLAATPATQQQAAAAARPLTLQPPLARLLATSLVRGRRMTSLPSLAATSTRSMTQEWTSFVALSVFSRLNDLRLTSCPRLCRFGHTELSPRTRFPLLPHLTALDVNDCGLNEGMRSKVSELYPALKPRYMRALRP